MGLGITLARITEEEADEFGYLFVKDQPELFARSHHCIRKTHFVFPGEEYDSEVYFYTELAYQSRGVVTAFYTDFTNDVCLTEQRQVARLAEYIDAEHKANFDAVFMNQFLEGQTIVIIGW